MNIVFSQGFTTFIKLTIEIGVLRSHSGKYQSPQSGNVLKEASLCGDVTIIVVGGYILETSL
jgi:hypothetical protein